MRARTPAVAAVAAALLGVAACSGGGGGADGGAGDRSGDDVTPAAVQELVVGYREDPWVDSEEDHKRFPSYP